MSVIIKGKNPKKPYTVRYWIDGRQKERSFRLKKDAEDFKASTDHETRAGTYTDPKLAAVPFGELATTWIGTRTAKRTRDIYESALRVHLQALAGRSLRQVANDRQGVSAAVAACPPSVQQNAVALISGTVNQAVKDRLITGHHLQGLDYVTAGRKAVIHHASRGQLDALAESLGDHALTVWLMRGTGVRIGEAMAVTPESIRGKTLRIERQRNTSGEIAVLKARGEEDYRDVPLPSYVADMMKDWSGFPPLSRSAYGHRWRAARDRIGLPKEFKPHSLRHIFASTLLANGTPVSDVSHYLGHRSINLTYAVYGHLIPESLGRARNVLDEEYEAWKDSEGQGQCPPVSAKRLHGPPRGL